MAKDRLKRRIAEALQGSSIRDELKLILGGDGATRQPHDSLLHPILDNVKDPILSVALDGIVQEANAESRRLLRDAIAEKAELLAETHRIRTMMRAALEIISDGEPREEPVVEDEEPAPTAPGETKIELAG